MLLDKLPSSVRRFADDLRIRKNHRIKEKAKKKQSTLRRGNLLQSERHAILQKTGGRCHICGGEIQGRWQEDHVLAHSAGGSSSPDNYLTAHSLCNNYRW